MISFEKYTPEVLKTEIKKAHQEALQELLDFKQQLSQKKPQDLTFAEVAEKLEFLGESFHQLLTVLSGIFSAHGTPEIRQLYIEMSPVATAYENEVWMDNLIHRSLKSVQAQAKTIEQQRLVSEQLEAFQRNGAHLEESKKNRIKQIDLELSELSPKFSENVLKNTQDFYIHILDQHDLEGLPQDIIGTMKELAATKSLASGWAAGLQAPHVIAILTFAQHRPLREKIWRAFNARGFGGDYDNRLYIEKIVRLRQERAQILGFPHHAAWTLRHRMAQDVSHVQALLDRIYAASFQKAKSELQQVREFAKSECNILDLQPWDFGFVSEKLKKALFDIDEETLKAYFPLSKVLSGLFQHGQKLFQLNFEQDQNFVGFHPDQKSYIVMREGQKIGDLLMDLFARDTKQAGAWMLSYQRHGRNKEGFDLPFSSITCNFTSPEATAAETYLSMNEVTTLFHEFGHALHDLLSKCEYKSLSGTQVLWDFVELPSQIMENWCFEEETLGFISRHRETGASLPATIIKKIKDSENFQSATQAVRQVRFSQLDMDWHTLEKPLNESIEDFERKSTQGFQLFPHDPSTNSSCAFLHIFSGGYSAGYYSYKWAEVLDADAFAYFKKEGIYNPRVAANFEEWILSKGNSQDPAVLYKNFRGRDPDPEALLRRSGLVT